MRIESVSASARTATRLRRIAVALPLLALLVIGAYLLRLERAHNDLYADTLTLAAKRAEQLATAKAQHIEALLTSADIVLRQFRDHQAAGHLDAALATTRSAFESFPKGSIVHFSVIGADGQIGFSTLDAPQRIFVGDRDYFKFHAEGGADRLFINQPIQGRSVKGWVVLLTRPILQSGRFAGVAVMSLSPQYISDALARQPVAADDVFTLIYSDGTYLARSRDLGKVLGTRLPPDRPFLQPGAADHGHFSVAANADQRTRVYAWQTLSGFPLVLNVGLDEVALLAPARLETRRSHQRNAIALPLVLLLVVTVSWLLLRSAREHGQLAASQATLRATLDATAEGFLVVTGQRQVLHMNQRFKSMWRLPDDLVASGNDAAMLDFAMAQLASPDGFRQAVDRLYQGDEVAVDLLSFADGRVFERNTCSVALDGQTARLWSFRDITELHQHRQQLEQRVDERTAALKTTSRQLAETLFAMDSVGIGVYWLDFDTGRILQCNRSAAQMLGYSVEQMLGLTVADIDPQGTAERFRARSVEARRLGHLQFETPGRKRDGQLIPREVTTFYQAAQDDSPPRLIAFFTDISRRKAAEQALLRAKEAAEAANVAKSAFLANMSHEIRTPLNAISGMAYLLRRDGLTTRQTDRLDRIDTAVKNLLETINAVLDLSRIEADRLTLDEAVLDLPAILANVADLLNDRAQAKGLRLVQDPHPPGVRLQGDAARLQQALLNYAGNAVKFTERGSVTLRTRVVEDTADSVLLRFEVEDTGIGIDAPTITRLFTAFEQADNSATRPFGGNGLGLAITRKLAQLMGGQAGVASEPGLGSTFWFTARLKKAEPGVNPPA